MKIVMSQAEIDCFTAFLTQCDHYFEFGIGGSTCLAAQTVGRSVAAIDSDLTWISEVRGNLPPHIVQVSLKHIDIGPTGGWGTPISEDCRNKFPDYSKSIRSFNIDDIDFCLVDGRFRVSCFFEALGQLRQDAVIAFHDYTSRPHYHVVEEFARPVCIKQQLAFFVRRPDASRSRVQQMADKYRYDYS